MADASVVFEVVSGNYRVQHAAVVMHAVYLGRMHEARDSAPMRISFTNIPKLDPKEM